MPRKVSIIGSLAIHNTFYCIHFRVGETVQ